MKFIIFVEGETEDKGVAGFINRWLSTQFAPGSAVGVDCVKFEGWADLRDGAPKRARLYLTDPAYRDVIAVVSLLDLYGPTFYPAEKTSVRDRYSWGCSYMQERVRQHFESFGLPLELSEKYHHFFAVHETEAWLVTRPELFAKEVQAKLKKQGPPEEINFNTPPGKLLEELYMKNVKRKYVKTTSGRNIFPRLDPAQVAEQCPYLREMLHKLRELARDAGAAPAGSWDR